MCAGIIETNQRPVHPAYSRRNFLKTASLAAMAAPALRGMANENPPVVLALLGAAHIHTPGYLALLKSRPEVRVKYVWDHEAARAERRAAECGARAVTDAALVWADAEVRGVVVCAETHRQRELVLAAARAGKHLFVEKPLGVTARESREMAEAIEAAGLIFTTGYFLRTEAKYLFLRDEIARGRFGTITRVRGSYCHRGALTGMFDNEWRWMANPEQAGGGAFANLGTHVVDLLLWCLGEPEAVTAQIRTVTGRYPGCDEAGEGLIRFKNGILATVAAGWAELDDPIRLLVSGTRAHALVWNNDLYFKCPDVPGADGTDPFTQLPPAGKPPLHQFVDAVAGRPDARLVPARDAAAAVRVMEAMYVAARENRWVRLDAPDAASPANPNPVHEPRPLTPSLSPGGGAGGRRPGEGELRGVAGSEAQPKL